MEGGVEWLKDDGMVLDEQWLDDFGESGTANAGGVHYIEDDGFTPLRDGEEDADNTDGGLLNVGTVGTSLVGRFKSVMRSIITEGSAIYSGAPRRGAADGDDASAPLTFVEELEMCYDYESSPGAQLAFGAFRFLASQSSYHKSRPIQTCRFPNDILDSFVVHTSSSSATSTPLSHPPGSAQYGIFKNDEGLRIWVLARGYGVLGGVLPDWFCLNFMKRITRRLLDINLNQRQQQQSQSEMYDARRGSEKSQNEQLNIKSIIKFIHQELSDDITSIIEKIIKTESQESHVHGGGRLQEVRNPKDIMHYMQTGVVATSGLIVNNKFIIISLCGNQQSYHTQVKYVHLGGADQPAVPYNVTKDLFKTAHTYQGKEKVRVKNAIKTFTSNGANGGGSSSHNISSVVPVSRRLIASNKLKLIPDKSSNKIASVTEGADEGVAQHQTHSPEATLQSTTVDAVVNSTALLIHGITRGFGFLDSQNFGLTATPDFVIIQTNLANKSTASIPKEFLLVASSPVFWQIRTPQETSSSIIRLMKNQGLSLQTALDRVCMSVRVESVARGYKAFNSEELIVLCIPLS